MTVDVKYVIKYSKRRTISICIKDTEVVVFAPVGIKKKEVDIFVLSKMQWIERHLQKNRLAASRFEKLFLCESFVLFGKELSIVAAKQKKMKLLSESFAISIPKELERDAIMSEAKKLYKKEATAYLHSRTELLSAQLHLPFRKLTITSGKTRWGSCTKKPDISLNFKLLFFDKKIIDYVIVHELCHTVFFNHSRDFWKLVGSFIPEYKNMKKVLKEDNVLIRLF